MSIVIELNPQVKKLIETAIKESRAFYLGVTDTSGAEIDRRCPMFLEPDGYAYEYFNSDKLQLNVDVTVNAHGCLISETPQGPPFVQGSITFDGRLGPRVLMKGDGLQFPRGHVRFMGKLP